MKGTKRKPSRNYGINFGTGTAKRKPSTQERADKTETPVRATNYSFTRTQPKPVPSWPRV